MDKELPKDKLTDYFELLEEKLEYKHWYCGHYHEDMRLDEKHSVMYYRIEELIE